MARSTYIYLVWCMGQLFGAYTVKHEMETATAGLAAGSFAVQRVKDGVVLV